MSAKGGIKRRQFLKKTAGGVLTAVGIPILVPSSVLGRNGKVAPSDRIVMGCIGVGGQGSYNLKAFLSMSDVQVVAVCDVDKGSANYDMLYQFEGTTAGLGPAQQRVEAYYAENGSGSYKGCDKYTDFRELLDRWDIDAVTVCTPDHWHGLISIAAAKAGKDIYCEKPLTNTIAEGRGVVDAVARYGRILQTGSHERSRDSVRFACELIQNGRIGRLHTIRVNMPVDSHGPIPPQEVMPVPESLNYDMWLGPTPWRPYTRKRSHFWWRFILDHGGGEMTDRGAHIIDIAQLALGMDHSGPVEISGDGTAPPDGLFDTFMDYKFCCKYETGVQLIGECIPPRGIKFEGSDGWIFIHIHGGRLEASPKSLLQEVIGPEEIQLGRSPGHHRNFLDSVKSRTDPVAPAMVGHRTASICHLLNIAMLTGQTLKWDPVAERIMNDPDTDRMVSRPMRSPWSLTI